MKFTEQQKSWLIHHYKELQQNAWRRNYSSYSEVFNSMVDEVFPNFLVDFVQRNNFDQVEICGIGTALYPEYLPALAKIHTAFPELRIGVLAIDLAFKLKGAEVFFLNALAQSLGTLLPDQIEPVTQEGWQHYEILELLISTNTLFDHQLQLPNHTQNVVVTAFHILNYIDSADFISFIQNPKIKAVCIANGLEWGKQKAFSPHRFGSFNEITTSMQKAGFQEEKRIVSKNQLQQSIIFAR